MKYNQTIAPVLCLALAFISINLGATVAALNPYVQAKAMQWGIIHFCCALAVGGLGSFWLAQKTKRAAWWTAGQAAGRVTARVDGRMDGRTAERTESNPEFFAASTTSGTAVRSGATGATGATGALGTLGAPTLLYSRLFRPEPAKRVCALACLALGLMAFSLPMLWPEQISRQPGFLPGAVLGLFWPLVIWVFFSAPGLPRPALLFGLGVAAGEAVWAALLPFIRLSYPAMPGLEQAVYLNKLLGLGLGLLGLGLACYLYAGQRPQDGPVEPTEPPEPAELAKPAGLVNLAGFGKLANSGEQARPCLQDNLRGNLRDICCLLGAGACFFALHGLGMGVIFPKISARQAVGPDLYFLTMFAAPAAGWLLESGCKRRYLWAVFSGIGLSVPLLLALQCNSALHALLFMGRSSLLVLLYTALVRLLRVFPAYWPLPFFAALVHLLYMAQAPGGALAKLPPNQAALAAAALAGLFCLLLMVALRQINAPQPATAKSPETCPEKANPAETGPPKPDLARPGGSEKAVLLEQLAVFSGSFKLTRRESQVLEGLVLGFPGPALQNELGISESTIRFHTTHLLRKTGQPTRQKLLIFFDAWRCTTGRAGSPPDTDSM